jgi:hypothetical protein
MEPLGVPGGMISGMEGVRVVLLQPTIAIEVIILFGPEQGLLSAVEE